MKTSMTTKQTGISVKNRDVNHASVSTDWRQAWTCTPRVPWQQQLPAIGIIGVFSMKGWYMHDVMHEWMWCDVMKWKPWMGGQSKKTVSVRAYRHRNTYSMNTTQWDVGNKARPRDDEGIWWVNTKASRFSHEQHYPSLKHSITVNEIICVKKYV